MSDEFGIFNDEGCVEGGFYSRDEAEAARTVRYAEDDDCHVSRCCPEHPEEEAETCENCMGDEEDDESSEEEDDE